MRYQKGKKKGSVSIGRRTINTYIYITNSAVTDDDIVRIPIAFVVRAGRLKECCDLTKFF